MADIIPDQFKLDPPVFVNPNRDQWLSMLKTYWETQSGKDFPTEGPEVDILSTMAQQLSILAQFSNFTGYQVLVAFATGTRLDQLAVFHGVTRVANTSAVCTVEFTTQNGVAITTRSIIRAGTEIQTGDGTAFTTDEDIIFNPGDISQQVTVTATVAGSAGNGIGPGEINQIIGDIANPRLANGTVTNIDTTSSGGETETDERLRRRLFFAISAKSTAGSKDMYEFYAYSYSPNIAGVYANALPDTGIAQIYVIEYGATPTSAPATPSSATLTAIYDLINSDEIRPMCDKLEAYAGTQVSYIIDIEVDYYPWAAPYIDEQLETYRDQLEEYNVTNAYNMGKDIVPNEIIALGMALRGVYNVRVTSPVLTGIQPSEYAYATSITVTKGVEAE